MRELYVPQEAESKVYSEDGPILPLSDARNQYELVVMDYVGCLGSVEDIHM